MAACAFLRSSVGQARFQSVKFLLAVTASIDVFPTIIRAADTAPTVDRVIDGRDILSLLKGEIKSVPT